MKRLLGLIVTIAFTFGCNPAFAGLFSSQGVDAYLRAPLVPTYSAVSAGSAPYATPTDICVIGGTATKTIKVLHVRVWGTQSTAGVNGFYLIKRSAFDNAASTTLTAVPHDSRFAAAGADVLRYTAAPTLGASLGMVRGADVVTAAAASTTNSVFDFDLGPTSGAAPVILHNNEVLALNFGGGAVPTGLVMSCEFVWQEE